MTKSNFPVVRVMSWSNFYHTSSKFHINIIISNNWNFFSSNRKFKHFSNNCFVAFIIRIYSNSSITKESFWTSCSNFNFATSVSIFIINMIHCTVCIFVVNFIISQSSSTTRTPVYKALAFVHKPAFIKSNKNITNSLRKPFVHSKTFSFPVCRVTKFSLLITNNVMMIFFNFPSAFNKFFTTKVITRFTFFFKLAFNNILSSNTSMVSSSYPKSIVPFHSVVTNNNILQSVVKPVSHVKNTSYIWRRNDDSVSISFSIAFFTLTMNRRIFITCRLKITFTFPILVNAFFKRFWVIRFF